MHGSTRSAPRSSARPRIASMPTRYVQPADPVYQVQPPRPGYIGCEYTSAATTYGSTR